MKNITGQFGFRTTAMFLWGITAAAAVMLSIAFALSARADTAPSVDLTIRNSGFATITSASIGSIVHASVDVASSTASTTPTGTVTFTLFPTATNCTGATSTEMGTLVNGSATSSGTTLGATGLSYLANYSGDATNSPAVSSCQPLTAIAPTPSITTTLSTTSAPVGTSVFDSAVLNNATANASGTVAYSFYTDNACSLGATNVSTTSVTNALIPSSTSIIFGSPGTFYWQAAYSGDTSNAAATSTCGAEILTVNATTTPPVPPLGTGSISGNVFNDANKNDVKDAGDSNLAGWTVWLHAGSSSDPYNDPIVMTALSDANGNYLFSNLAFGPYFVEEQEQTGWNQTSDDTNVTLSSGPQTAVVNFSNVTKSGQQSGDGHHRCDGKHNDDDRGCASTTPLDTGHPHDSNHSDEGNKSNTPHPSHDTNGNHGSRGAGGDHASNRHGYDNR